MSVLLFVAPLAAVAALVATLCAAVVAPCLSAWRRLSDARGSTTLFAGLVLLPIAAGMLGALALASANPYAACHCVLHGLHHPHLCPRHPELGAPLIGPALAVLAAWLAAATPGLLRLARESIGAERWALGAARLPAQVVDGVRVRVHGAGAAGAFTAGLLRPMVSVDRTLWDGLSPDERRAVIHHEHAHVVRRDGLTLWLLRLAGALLPLSGSGWLIERWREAVEAACDRHAAAKVDAETVASALVAVERAHDAVLSPARAAPGLALGMWWGRGLASAVPEPPVERRVLAVLEARPARADSLVGDLLPLAIVLLGASVLTVAWPGDAVHHGLETAIGFLLR